MVIAHVIDSLEIGGAEMVVDALCRSHAAAGHHVEVHCVVTGGSLPVGAGARRRARVRARFPNRTAIGLDPVARVPAIPS